MLQIARRHTKACIHDRKQHDREWRKCNCNITISGTINREKVRQSLHTRNWNAAARLVMDAESRGYWQKPAGAKGAKSITEAVDLFLADAESEKGRALRSSTISKYKTLTRRLKEFAQERGLIAISDLTPEHIRDFRDSWPTGVRSSANYLNSLKCLLKWCVENQWIEKSPATIIKPPKQHGKADTQKIPYTEDEMNRLVEHSACDQELQTLVLLMRTTGMRISDAAFLSTDQVQDGYLKVNTRKTGSRIAMPLHPNVWLRLQNTQLKREKYYFLGESDRLATATDVWRRKFKALAKRAEVSKPSLHRLRHTAAVGWLLAGMSTESVGKLLGHSSPSITAKFYSAFTRERERALADEVKKLWDKAA